ncbi:helicase domain protein [Nitzschia inconspicua]|uniref:Helicase domain protein n=1 Tax=Nitzschia inconspicua TaxID=303405 RepID=A0A9K3M216_9STRA|nr:helicase domain protein [Nitzschia inconspicua]KAG7372818.1 helicase domain protein [Nitzschia inconspicua]
MFRDLGDLNQLYSLPLNTLTVVSSSTVPPRRTSISSYGSSSLSGESSVDTYEDEFDIMLSKLPLLEDNGEMIPEQTNHSSFPSMESLKVLVPSRNDGSGTCCTKRSRKYQTGQWNDRYQELLIFQRQHGHLFVPHSYPSNQKLAQWVKRQRYQYKLKQNGQHSTLSIEREELLSSAGFIWDSHAASWQEQFQMLEHFFVAHGHCNVPTRYQGSTALNVWCKHQRKQYKLFQSGLCCTLTQKRVDCLNSIGFNWCPRKNHQSMYRS